MRARVCVCVCVCVCVYVCVCVCVFVCVWGANGKTSFGLQVGLCEYMQESLPLPPGCEVAEIAIHRNAMFTMCVIYVYIMNAVRHCIVVLWLTLFRICSDMESSLYLRMRGGCKVAEYQ